MYRISQPLAATQFGDDKPKKKKKTVKKEGYVSDKSQAEKTVKKGNKTKTKEVYSESGYSNIKKTKTKKKGNYTSTKSSDKVIQREGPGKRAAKKITGSRKKIKAAKKLIKKGTYPENAARDTKIPLDGNAGSTYSKLLKSRASAKNKAKQEGTSVKKSRKNFVKSYNTVQKNVGNPERLKSGKITGKIKTVKPMSQKKKIKARKKAAKNK